mgnify:CR=1 FL=1
MPTDKFKAVDKDRLRSIISSEITHSMGFMGGELSEQRRTAMDYYYGKPFGNEIDGRSQVVLTDVFDTIEWIMPALMKIFAGGEKVVQFDAVGPEDEELSEQQTEYVNHIFQKDNEGFMILYEWFKDALLQKNGTLKVYWDDSDVTDRESYTDLSEDELALLLDEEGTELVEQRDYEKAGSFPVAEGAQVAPEVMETAYDITILRTHPANRVKIHVMPPEEFLISRRATSIEDASFTGHRVRKTVSELIQMGFDEEQVMRLQSGGTGEGEFNEERIARFDIDDEYPDVGHSIDPSMREVWIIECYLKVDYDGDGIAELRKVTVGGDANYEIMDNVPADDIPFVSLTPIKIPHKFFGWSVADMVGDLQLIRSTILRQLLDNMYGVNNNRFAVMEGEVEMDDLLTNRPSGIVRTNRPPGEVLMPIQTPTLGQFAYPLLEFTEQIRESRTGVTRYSQGLDPNSLNKTATGINILTNKADERIEMIARTFAETGVKDLFRKINKLVVNNQDEARTVRLRNEWIPIDPRSWNTNMDLTVNVGIGMGNMGQKAQAIGGILNVQKQAVEFQGGADGPLVKMDNLYNSFKELAVTAGFKNANLFFTDPQGVEPPPPKPDPEAQKVQGEMQMEQAKFKMEQEKMQASIQTAQQRMQMEMAREKLKLQMNQEEHNQSMIREQEKFRMEMQMEQQKNAAEIEAIRAKAGVSAQVARAQSDAKVAATLTPKPV